MVRLLISYLMSSGLPMHKTTIVQSKQMKDLLSMRAGQSFGRHDALAATEPL